MAVYAANASVWRHVQCLAVTDSSSSTRACCACADPNFCPFDNFPQRDSGYCRAEPSGCIEGSAGERCRQLAAGCGVSVYDASGHANQFDPFMGANVGMPSGVSWREQQCSREQISSGQCGLCTRPLWCNDEQDDRDGFGFASAPIFGVRTPEQWLRLFYDRDGGRAMGSRQCKWKRSQKASWLQTIIARNKRRAAHPIDKWGHHYDHAQTWNEVNFYVGQGDDGLAIDLWHALQGLLYVRNAGNDADLENLRRLRAHLKALGRDVPLFAVNAEAVETVRWWRSDVMVDLTQSPYNLEVLES